MYYILLEQFQIIQISSCFKSDRIPTEYFFWKVVNNKIVKLHIQGWIWGFIKEELFEVVEFLHLTEHSDKEIFVCRSRM